MAEYLIQRSKVYSVIDRPRFNQKVSMKLVVSEDVFIEYIYTINLTDYIINLDISSKRIL
ncbi:MAG: hypothetical protein CM15mP36_11470 [Flavobacteriales bacterium]|nr:MAG: hypothetical protein CM15mP36_11470 [Flavobacteriales bacterium]